MKGKKNVLFGAIATIAVCLSIVVGATFALFTSTSEVNVAVTAGTVKLTATIDGELTTSHQEWNETEGKYVEKGNLYNGTATLDAAKQTLTLDNIAPSDKASFTIAVKNESTVPVKYRTIITSVSDNGLAAGLVIKVNDVDFVGSAVTAWTDLAVGGTIDNVSVSIELPVEASDEYQAKNCILSYKVEAVQANGKVLNGVTFTSGKTILNNDINVGVVDDPNGAPAAVLASGADTEVTILGGNYDGGSKANNKCVYAENGATVTIKDGNFTVGGDNTGLGNSVVFANGGATVYVEGGVFYTESSYNGKYYVLNIKNGSNSHIIVSGGSFYEFNPDTGDDVDGTAAIKLADGYKVVTESNKTINGVTGTWYTVVPEE